MRVLMIADFYHPYVGGVEQHVRGLSHALARRGHQVVVATLAHPERPAHELDGPVRVVRLQGLAQRANGLHAHTQRRWAPPAPDPLATQTLARIVRRFKPDVVHGHEWLARSYLPLKPLFPAKLVMSLHYYTAACAKKTLMRHDAPCAGPDALRCLACSVEHYGTAKGPVALALHRAGTLAERKLVDHFIAVSSATVQGNQIADRRNVSVIPNFITQPAIGNHDYSDYYERLPERPYFLFVGDFRRDKGIGVLLDAYARLDESRPPLVLIGKTWDAGLADLPARAVNLGEWPNDAVQLAWQRALAGVVPSVWAEPFGLVLLEAMNAGKPVVASRVGGIPDVVNDGDNGLLAPPDDPVALAAALAHIAGDEALRARLAAGARRTAAMFSEERAVLATETVYQDLLAQGRAA